MSFGQPEYGYCKKMISAACPGKRDEKSLIVNKSRACCKWCNEEIKAGEKAAKRERVAILRETLDKGLNEILERKQPSRLINRVNKSSAKDQKFYRECWGSRQDWKGACVCEECGMVLHKYSSVYVSHIISRGADTRLRYHKLNFNILCWLHHTQWESGDRTTMKIFDRNMATIEKLKSELNQE